MPISSRAIRTGFIEFFRSKQHTFVPSAPVIPQDDPTLLFTNAGMNQFKSIFLGDNPKALRRAANTQKCMRVSGKHNDLEEVGRDHHHHTFFEMLGNWSFGDYYKREAILWAWELLTGVWQLPKDKLFATVHTSDDEADAIWRRDTDIDPGHIIRSEENFWEMGETGPCGPCSEIHIDRGPGHCVYDKDPRHRCEVNASGCGRFVELWNLVFMQNNRQKDGSLVELPSKNIDTGMGFERVVAVMQNVKSNYDTDVFMPIINALAEMSGTAYGHGPQGTPFRVIADHIRSLVFAITDGAFPSNEGRGYVLRRLLRRAVRFGRELGFSEPFLYKLAPVVITVMGEAFPEIAQRNDYVQEVIRAEEERFGQTLEQGLAKFGDMIAQCKGRGSSTLTGADVFALYDTYGFPMDLTRLMAREQGLTVDEAGYEALMTRQRERAREAQRSAGADGLSAEGWVEVAPGAGTEFVGYDRIEARVRVTRYKPIVDNGETAGYVLILDTTPFYAESGGQVGDRGVLVTHRGFELHVEDTVKWHDTIVHKTRCPAGLPPAELLQPMKAFVAPEARAATRRNHSATHLLQAALRNVLGDHVQQSGSRVDPAELRFDFTHFKAPTADELAAVEKQVNDWVVACLPVTGEVKPIEVAKREGATALFGEKYGDTVRVVTMGAVSKELCGGTHVSLTGEIGLFHIVAESSIAAGVRRIEAVTGLNALELLALREATVGRLTGMLKVGGDKLVDRVTALMENVRLLEADVAALRRGQARRDVAALIDEAKSRPGGCAWVVKDLGVVERAVFASLADVLSDKIREQALSDSVFVLGATDGRSAFFAACAGAAAVEKRGIHCGRILKQAAQKAGGSGGGSPVRAQAGAKSPEKLGEALALAEQLVKEKAER